MNLVDGAILSADDCEPILENLEHRLIVTLEQERLNPNVVIAACHKLASELDEERYLAKLDLPGISPALGRRYIAEAKEMLRADILRARLSMELGDNYTQRTEPIGVLLHMAAGNADGLPAFSVLEGLLTGNINILKLPAAEGGLTLELLADLIRTEPSLSKYIYVFDYSSHDLTHIMKLLSVADAVVVWGGDEAIAALRTMVKPNTKLIEWGHKVSFGYVTRSSLSTVGLSGFARNIVETGQMLCSSCQGLYVDTADMEEIYALSERFLPLLEHEAGALATIGIAAQATLELYTASLMTTPANVRVFRGRGCGIIAQSNSYVESAPAPRVPWIKPLPREQIVRTLHPYKNHLQTVGLLCSGDERISLAQQFFKTGVVRITQGENMSCAKPNAPHDGEYPLRRYVKITNIE